MKKIIPILVVGILVISGFGAVGLPEDRAREKTDTITFSEPTINDEGEYVNLEFQDTDTYLKISGNPMIPMYVKVFYLPFGVENVKIDCKPHDIYERSVPKEVVPTPQSAARIYDKDYTLPDLIKNEEIYSSADPYPSEWYSYRIGVGLNEEDAQSTIVAIHLYPVKYVPLDDKIYYTDGADVKVTYEKPAKSLTKSSSTEYDMVIIAPLKFSWLLQKLVKHKNDHGVRTILKTTLEIYANYEGVDEPEKIKNFIMSAKEKWNITYVLIVGGLTSYTNAYDKDDCNHGSRDWNVPVRYTNIVEGAEIGCPSDLYFSDIYKYDESKGKTDFENWDPNFDVIFAEYYKHPGVQNDRLDLYPDVYLGRLACRNIFEVMLMVNKIINYEKAPANPSWFKRMVVIAGKTFDLYEGVPDGEVVCNTALDYMGDLIDDPVTVYVSNNDTGGYRPTTDEIIEAFSQGAGYVNFQGHGNPIAWDTIWADGNYPKDWSGGLRLFNFWRLANGRRLPVVIVGGCHNALYNVSIYKTLHSSEFGGDHWYWTHGTPAPVCFSWGLCVIPYGGAIASTGCTGYGMGYVGKPISLSSEMESNFFYQIGQQGATTPGQAHGGSIRKFINENGLGQVEYHCITVFELFGDPSLHLGGYPS